MVKHLFGKHVFQRLVRQVTTLGVKGNKDANVTLPRTWISTRQK